MHKLLQWQKNGNMHAETLIKAALYEKGQSYETSSTK